MTGQCDLLANTHDSEQQKNDATMFPPSRNPVHLQSFKENDQSSGAEETVHYENPSSNSSSYSTTISSAAHTTEATSVELTVGRPSGGTDWERQGARPKQLQHSEERQLPREGLVQFSDILGNGVSEQSTENSVFAETSVVEPVHREEDKHEQFGGRGGSSKQRAKERREKEDVEKQKAASWPQKGETTCSQQFREQYNNQSSLSSSRTQSDRNVEDIPLLRQGAFPDAEGTVNGLLGTRDWERQGAKLKQARKKVRSEVVPIPNDPLVPQFTDSLIESSRDPSLSEEQLVQRTVREGVQREQFEGIIKNTKKWLMREQRAKERGERKVRGMQEAENKSQEETAACSQQLRQYYYSQCSLTSSRTQGIVGNIPWSQQDTLVDAGRPSTATYRERDGLTDEFLSRHTQDKALYDSLYQSTSTGVSLLNDISAEGTSHIDGYVSLSRRANPYFGDNQATSQTDGELSTGHRAQNPTFTLGNVNSAAGNENARDDLCQYLLNQSVSVSSPGFSSVTGLHSAARSQGAMFCASSNAAMFGGEVLTQENAPVCESVREPHSGGSNNTRGAPIRVYVPESLDTTGNVSAWVPQQQDPSQQFSRGVSVSVSVRPRDPSL